MPDSSPHKEFCVLLPAYNHGATLTSVATDIRKLGYDLLVVNDGSTDATAQVLAQLQREELANETQLHIISYEKNRGKGYALRMGIRRLKELGYRCAVSIDADGQHLAQDIDSFVAQAGLSPSALLVGARGMKHTNMPEKNSFANRFSNFWFALQTGRLLPDTQSGFRLYPIAQIAEMRFLTTRYEWELEVLVRAAWAGVPIIPIPISVYYPPKNERVTHFRPTWDFLRITILNTFFCLAALCYFYPRSLFRLLFHRSYP